MPFQTHSRRSHRVWCCPTDHACPVKKLEKFEEKKQGKKKVSLKSKN
jgi:hypothetical protein